MPSKLDLFLICTKFGKQSCVKDAKNRIGAWWNDFFSFANALDHVVASIKQWIGTNRSINEKITYKEKE